MSPKTNMTGVMKSSFFILLFFTAIHISPAWGFVLNGMPIDTGSVAVDDNWRSVVFREQLTDPVVIARPLTANDGDPFVVRIRNVGADGFEIRLQEWDYLDGDHAEETVGYVAIDRGDYTLSDGTLVEAGFFATNSAGPLSFAQVPFVQAFNQTPVVITGVSSFNDEQAVTGRVDDVGAAGFSFAMQEQSSADQQHGTEEVSYIAWEPSVSAANIGIRFEVGKTDPVVTNDPFAVTLGNQFVRAPLIIADLQTANGPDPATLSLRNLSTGGFEVGVQEEQSDDEETIHTLESVGYLAVSRTSLLFTRQSGLPFWVDIIRDQENVNP